MPGGNTRHTVFQAPYPLYAVRGEGARVIDADGAARLDFVNNYTSLIHGHGFAPVVEAIRRQALDLVAVGAPTEAEIELAELLVARVPSLERVRFCNSGSEAVMFAMKAARAATGRTKIAKIEGTYHGSYDYAEVSQQPKPRLWGEADRPQATATSQGTPQGVLDDVIVLPMNDLAAARAILAAHADDLAGVLLDPLPSRLMFVAMTPAFAQGVAEATRAAGGMVIIDEVYTLRLDLPGRQPALGVTADLVTMGKIIGGGLPIGAFGGSAAAMAVFDGSEGPARVQHGGTFNASPLAMAAGLAAMRAFDDRCVAQVNALGARLREGLSDILRTRNVGGPVLGVGSLATFMPGAEGPIETVRDVVREAGAFRTLARMQVELLNRGVFINPALHYVVSSAMTETDIDFTLEQTDKALAVAA
jgi:glutamate-1-semialdehyde 2,1-aminomutase